MDIRLTINHEIRLSIEPITLGLLSRLFELKPAWATDIIAHITSLEKKVMTSDERVKKFAAEATAALGTISTALDGIGSGIINIAADEAAQKKTIDEFLAGQANQDLSPAAQELLTTLSANLGNMAAKTTALATQTKDLADSIPDAPVAPPG